MAIGENQLEIWSNQGATTSSATTYASVKNCIDAINWNSDIRYEVYLQGSYKNSTNIYGNSDVDVVVEFKSIFYSNKDKLPEEELAEFNAVYSDGKYSLSDFKLEIVKGLKAYYGEDNVIVGNKSIKIRGGSGRLASDVICCAEYREYRSFRKIKMTDYSSGIIYWGSKTGEEIINFPNIHFRKGADKNSNCSTNFKPSVRIIKNMRSRLVDSQVITNDLAPSYFLECLLYNVPNVHYQKSTYQEIVVAVLNYLSAADKESFVCQNEQRYLFGSSAQQWNIKNCDALISALIRLWNNP